MPPVSRYINPDLRQLVVERAEYLCEYCLIHEDDTYLGCEIDHIISLKHGGTSDADNLAYACAFCNRHKGSDVGSVLNSEEFVPFYNPRRDRWAEHFRLDSYIIRPLTSIGEATAKILLFNTDERILERESLIDSGRYPSLATMKLL
ncbi:HNH endonuclease [Candidatus Electrothrix sp.]|uniref:HNH endonuclease n=1 Tax=Candidatus Electrothrix sp. TaxID=2170559 RepID=UPI0040563A24